MSDKSAKLKQQDQIEDRGKRLRKETFVPLPKGETLGLKNGVVLLKNLCMHKFYIISPYLIYFLSEFIADKTSST